VSFRARALPAGLALAGVAVITLLVIYFGANQVLTALTSVRPSGFAAYVAAQLAITLGLALCWRMLLRSHRRGNFWLLVWGRLVRDATGEFLPFSQVGGYVLGARVITLGGVDPADAAASTLADITTEFLAEIAFIGIGLACLAHFAPHNRLLLPVASGLCVAIIMGIGLILLQRGGNGAFRTLALRIASRMTEGAASGMDRLQFSLDQVYRDPLRLGLAALFHLCCWFGTATASYIGFHALGVQLSFPRVLVVEALLHAVMALSFFVPGRVGIQEAAYTLLAALFGVPPQIALSLSLLRRARDFVIAVPVLLAWQGMEAKQLAVLRGAGKKHI
jgi:putative membrane protein